MSLSLANSTRAQALNHDAARPVLLPQENYTGQRFWSQLPTLCTPKTVVRSSDASSFLHATRDVTKLESVDTVRGIFGYCSLWVPLSLFGGLAKRYLLISKRCKRKATGDKKFRWDFWEVVVKIKSWQGRIGCMKRFQAYRQLILWYRGSDRYAVRASGNKHFKIRWQKQAPKEMLCMFTSIRGSHSYEYLNWRVQS